MTRTEAMAIITAALPALDDARIAALAEIAQSMSHDTPPLELTDAELAALKQSRADFAEGRTLTAEEARAETDAFMAELATKYPHRP
jgi:predicted transcriptional regulator